MKKKEGRFEFFWDNCTPAKEEKITESIREKTFRKIDAGIERPLVRFVDKKKSRRIYLAVASIAASVAILFITIYLFMDSPGKESFQDAVARMEQSSSAETDQITLTLSTSEKLHVVDGEQIKYTDKGNLFIGNKALAPENKHESVSGAAFFNQLTVPKGKRSKLLLSDGTKVWVNAGTKVIYPRTFNKDKREIYVDGEIYLEVSHDANHPFYVNTSGSQIKVLGTSFNVFAYKQMSRSSIALVEGAVEVKDRENRQLKMSPNELVSLEGNRIIDKKRVDATDYKAWINDILILRGETLANLTERLSLLYGVQIVCDSSLGEEQVYGKFDLRNTCDDMIDYINLMIPLSVHKEGNTYYLKKN